MNRTLIATLFLAASATAVAGTSPAKPAATKPAATKPAPAAAAGPTLDMVPPFIGACMQNGPDADKIRAVVIKAGGKAAPQQAGKSATDPSRLEAYLFENSGAPYSVIFDRQGTCSIVTGRADIDVTRNSLDRLVIGSSKVFDISQTEAKPHATGETVAVEYKLNSKNDKGGLLLTLSRVTDPSKGTAVFLTRRIFNNK
jgi:hypothetical protein